DYPHFALGILFRVARVRCVDHNGLAEFTPNRTGRCFRGIGRAEYVADLAYGFDTFIDQCNALFRAWVIDLVRGRFGGGLARHEPDNVLELIITEDGPEDFAELLLLLRPDFQAEFLFDRRFGLGRHYVLKLAPKRFANRRIKLN